MRMPTRNAKHVLILSEALDIGRFEAGAGEQELGLIEKGGDGHKGFVHDHAVRAREVSRRRSRLNNGVITFTNQRAKGTTWPIGQGYSDPRYDKDRKSVVKGKNMTP